MWPNMFGKTVGPVTAKREHMTANHQPTAQTAALISETDAPDDAPMERLDVQSLGPPKPLKQTLERLRSYDDTILVQFTDRDPQHPTRDTTTEVRRKYRPTTRENNSGADSRTQSHLSTSTKRSLGSTAEERRFSGSNSNGRCHSYRLMANLRLTSGSSLRN